MIGGYNVRNSCNYYSSWNNRWFKCAQVPRGVTFPALAKLSATQFMMCGGWEYVRAF